MSETAAIGRWDRAAQAIDIAACADACENSSEPPSFWTFVCVYAATAMLVAQSEQVHGAPGWAQGLFFGIVGLAWVLPLMPLVAWMERPDADDPVQH